MSHNPGLQERTPFRLGLPIGALPGTVLTLLLGLLLPALAAADAGDLDPSFGDAGMVLTSFSVRFSRASGVAIQTEDGKIVVVGSVSPANPWYTQEDFGVARYNPNGTLDTSFGVGGLVMTDFGHSEDQASDVIIQPLDGKIVVGGTADGDLAMVRYHPDGSRDSTFGTNGVVITRITSRVDWIAKMALLENGKIVTAGIAGPTSSGTNYDWSLARYNPDGSLDATFGVGGIVTTDFSGREDYGDDMVLQPDGKILVVGRTVTDRELRFSDFGLARYDPDGTLDGTFGIGGQEATDSGYRWDIAAAAVLQIDGKILVGGSSDTSPDTNLDFDFGVARYTDSGALDTESADFGGGWVNVHLTDGTDWVTGLALQANGKIVEVGYITDPPTADDDLAVVRFLADGELDIGFGEGGYRRIDINGRWDQSQDVVIQPDGKIIVVGGSWVGGFWNEGSPTSADFLVMRFEGLDSPQEEIEDLVDIIDDLVVDGTLNEGEGNALLSKLEAAVKQLDKGNETTAVNQLEAFIHQLEALVNSGRLSPEEGLQLIDTVTTLINSLLN